jgi:hypothetical protein
VSREGHDRNTLEFQDRLELGITTAITGTSIAARVATTITGTSIAARVATAVTGTRIAARVATTITGTSIAACVATAVTGTSIAACVATAVTGTSIIRRCRAITTTITLSLVITFRGLIFVYHEFLLKTSG